MKALILEAKANGVRAFVFQKQATPLTDLNTFSPALVVDVDVELPIEVQMSFDLKIKLPKGFEPEVAVVEMPPLKHDRDRSPEEDRQWQEQRYERAQRKAREAAWAPFSRNVTVRGMVVVKDVLRRAGAIYRGDSSLKSAKGSKFPRGPGGEVDERKFGSNDGWLVTPDECAFVAGRLKAWLDNGGEALDRDGVSWDLTPDAKDKDDKATRSLLFEVASLFARASQYGGLEVC